MHTTQSSPAFPYFVQEMRPQLPRPHFSSSAQTRNNADHDPFRLSGAFFNATPLSLHPPNLGANTNNLPSTTFNMPYNANINPIPNNADPNHITSAFNDNFFGNPESCFRPLGVNLHQTQSTALESNASPLSHLSGALNTKGKESPISASRRTEKIRRLQMPGILVLINVSNFEVGGARAAARLYPHLSANKLSYARLLNLIASPDSTFSNRQIVSAHAIISQNTFTQQVAGLTITAPPLRNSQHVERSADHSLVRLMTQEFEGVHLLGCAPQRTFCVVAASDDCIDVVRHARFSGCDVELWFWLDSNVVPTIWAMEMSFEHDNIGALRIYDLHQSFLFLLGVHDHPPKPVTPAVLSHPHTYPNSSSALIINSSIDTSAMSYSLPVSGEMQQGKAMQKQSLSAQLALPSHVWEYRSFIQQAQNKSSTSSSPYCTGRPTIESTELPGGFARTLSSTVSQLQRQGLGNLQQKSSSSSEKCTTSKKNGDCCFTEDKESRNDCSNYIDGPSPNASPTNSNSSIRENGGLHGLCSRPLTMRKTKSQAPPLPSGLLFLEGTPPPSSSSTSSSSLTNDPADSPSPPKLWASGTFLPNTNGIVSEPLLASSPTDSYATFSKRHRNIDQNWRSGGRPPENEIELVDGLRKVNRDSVSLDQNDDTGDSNEENGRISASFRTLSSKSPKQSGVGSRGRCTYREFCNRRQCNGTHTRAELIYFSRFGGRAKYCIGKQKMCARGATCDGRKRRSGVCSFLHQGELPFCAACLGSHGEGTCSFDREKPLSEGDAAQLINSGCLVPINAR